MDPHPATGLTLVLGPANSGKLGRVLRWWEDELELQPLVVVPTGPDARSLSAEMAQRRGALVGQSPATTFDGLVRLLLGRSPRYVSDLERSLLVGHLLHEAPSRTQGLSDRFPGTAAAVASLLQQLGDSGRPPDELAEALSRWVADDSASAPLAADIGRLLAGYSALRDRLGLSERCDALRQAHAAVPAWGRPLAFYGFTSFTLAQRRLVAALAQVCGVLLVLDHDSEGARGLTTEAEFRAWQQLAARIEELRPTALAYTSPAIAHLERFFLDDSPPAAAPPAWEGPERGGVRFSVASGQRNEAEAAADWVAGLVRQGVTPGEIAVIVRSSRTWGSLLEEVFASCGIPCEVDQRVTLGETGPGHAFLAGLRGMAEDDPGSVFHFLRSPYSALTLEESADVQFEYLRGSARGVQALAACAGGIAQRVMQELGAAVCRRSGGAVVDLDAALGLAASMLRNCLGGFAGAAEHRGRGADVRRWGNSDARALRALGDALSSLAAHRQEGRLPEGVFRMEVLLPTLGRLAVPGASTGSAGAVQVLTAHRARARRFQAVLVLGLVEGEFPRRGVGPALLTSGQRSRLDSLAGGLFPPDIDEEPLFVRAVSRAWKYLFLSARDADDGGGFAGQSHFWTHSRALLQVADEHILRRTLADQVFGAAQAPCLRQYLRSCTAGRLEPHPGCGPASLETPAWRRVGGLAGLDSPPVLAELSGISCFSPSALESYLRCPFAWFVQNIVGAKELETEVDGRLTGELLHRVLRDTFRRLKTLEALPLQAEHLQSATALAVDLIEEMVNGGECAGSPAERRILEWRLRSMTAEVLAMEVAAGCGMIPTETELSVGGDSGVDVGGLALRGRVDRVDLAAGGEAFIVDYKSRTVPGKNDIATKEGLQLPLYILVLLTERPELRVIGGAYVSPSEGKRTGVVAAGREHLLGPGFTGCVAVEQEAFQAMLEQSLGLAKEAAEGMRRGDIAPLPGRKCPAWCDLGPVCRARVGGRRW